MYLKIYLFQSELSINFLESILIVDSYTIPIDDKYCFLNVWKYKEWAANKAFADIPTGFMRLAKRLLTGPEIEVPQLKSRIFEAAFCRSLILCKKDNFNVIEKYFMPGEEFVYYEEGRLVETVNKVLTNYDAYLSVIENAYNRAVKQYTTNAFFEKYLKVI